MLAAQKVFNELAKLKSNISGELEDTCAVHMLQSLNLILHMENARAMLRRIPHKHSAGNAVLSASATAHAPP